ncbi:MAG: hypothetical protein OEX07_13355, partial [Gammaproteobacteria bacterium]|nr:hypothetical protein [Gammaproteobacteria bacterium]
GTYGAAYAYDSLSLPADNGKEIRGLITTPAHVVSGPGALILFKAYENTSFDLVVSDDCTIEWTYSLYVDGVLDTLGLTGSVAIGSRITSTITAGNFFLSGFNITNLYNKKSMINSGSYSFVASSTNNLINRISGINSGSFTLDGTTIDGIYNQSITVSLINSGLFVLTGSAISNLYKKLSPVVSGSFNFNGLDVRSFSYVYDSELFRVHSGIYFNSSTKKQSTVILN